MLAKLGICRVPPTGVDPNRPYMSSGDEIVVTVALSLESADVDMGVSARDDLRVGGLNGSDCRFNATLD